MTMIREAVGIFDDGDKLFEAINDLESSGFDRAEISVLSGEETIKEKFGKKRLPNARAMAENPETPREVPIRPEEVGLAQGVAIGSGVFVGAVATLVLTGGSVIVASAPVLTAAVIGGGASGGLLGGLLAKMIGDYQAEELKSKIDRGGLILWVNTPDGKRERIAKKILSRHGVKNVYVHDIKV